MTDSKKIIYYPDERLLSKSHPVSEVTDQVKLLIDEMYQIMYDNNGVGLAASQIGLLMRLAVIDVSEDKTEQICIINPEIIDQRGQKLMLEGCLSVPGAYESVSRAEWVKVRALDANGKSFELEAEGVLSEALQHEIDHMEGTLYIDKLSTLKRQRVLSKMKKFQRQKRRR